MSRPISLREAERETFRVAYNDGLWDIFLGCFFLMFVIAPFLSSRLGDFWSSAVFLPFWAGVFLVIRLIRKRVVEPRIGSVRFGHVRQARLARFTVVMLVVNVVAFILGLLAAMSFGRLPGQVLSAIFGLILLAGFSLSAYFLDWNRLYIYGLLAGLSPVVGEWLYVYADASHHGFPVTFGATAGVMFIVGATVFVRLLRNHPVPVEGNATDEA